MGFGRRFETQRAQRTQRNTEGEEMLVARLVSGISLRPLRSLRLGFLAAAQARPVLLSVFFVARREDS